MIRLHHDLVSGPNCSTHRLAGEPVAEHIRVLVKSRSHKNDLPVNTLSFQERVLSFRFGVLPRMI